MSFNARFALRYELCVPQRQPAQQEKRARRDEGFVNDDRSSRKEGKYKLWLFIFISLFRRKYFVVNDFKSESHDEKTAQHSVDHVEEEVSVVEVAYAAVDPRTVVIVLKYATVFES